MGRQCRGGMFQEKRPPFGGVCVLYSALCAQRQAMILHQCSGKELRCSGRQRCEAAPRLCMQGQEDVVRHLVVSSVELLQVTVS
jgi:hypothetical protein